MMGVLAPESSALCLRPFRRADAEFMVNWVRTDADVRLLAPSTQPPLTAEKILQWQLPRGRAYVGVLDSSPMPVFYGELNPMPQDPQHRWLGHCIVVPNQQGRGLGKRFVRRILDEAFGPLKAARVSLIVFPENQRAVRCYLGAGFEAAGEEWHSFRGGTMVRMLRMEALSPQAG